MHIFNLDNRPYLIITNTELLFRDTPTDESMNRHTLRDVEKISFEHRYDADKELFIWLKVQMKGLKTPHLIQLSSLDTPLEEVFLALDTELSGKVSISLPKATWLHEVQSHHKKRKQIILGITLLLAALFLFHKFYTPTLDAFVKEAIDKQFQDNRGLCSAQAKVAYRTSKKDWITIKSYCGVFGVWKEMESKDIPAKHLETEFSKTGIQEYTTLIQDAISSKNYSLAKENINKVLYLEPKNANAYLLLGVVNYESGNRDEAFTAMEKALSLDENSLSILNRVSFYYTKDEQYEKAYVYAQKALKISNATQELYRVALLETKLGKRDKAIEHFEKSLYEESNNTVVYNQLGLLYWQKHAYAKAATVFKKAYEIKPKSATNFLNYYEISLIEESTLSTQEIQEFENSFHEDKDVFITYKMLRILKLAINEEDIMPSLQSWDKNYSGVKLNWSFEEILSWVDSNSMNEEQKYNMKKTIGFFIAYQQIYNLEHQEQIEVP